MLFLSLGGYMLKNTKAIICFILFSHQFSDRFLIQNQTFKQSTKLSLANLAGVTKSALNKCEKT